MIKSLPKDGMKISDFLLLLFVYSTGFRKTTEKSHSVVVAAANRGNALYEYCALC